LWLFGLVEGRDRDKDFLGTNASEINKPISDLTLPWFFVQGNGGVRKVLDD